MSYTEQEMDRGLQNPEQFAKTVVQEVIVDEINFSMVGGHHWNLAQGKYYAAQCMFSCSVCRKEQVQE